MIIPIFSDNAGGKFKWSSCRTRFDGFRVADARIHLAAISSFGCKLERMSVTGFATVDFRESTLSRPGEQSGHDVALENQCEKNWRNDRNDPGGDDTGIFNINVCGEH